MLLTHTCRVTYLVDVGEWQERHHGGLVIHLELMQVTVHGLRHRAMTDNDTFWQPGRSLTRTITDRLA